MERFYENQSNQNLQKIYMGHGEKAEEVKRAKSRGHLSISSQSSRRSPEINRLVLKPVFSKEKQEYYENLFPEQEVEIEALPFDVGKEEEHYDIKFQKMPENRGEKKKSGTRFARKKSSIGSNANNNLITPEPSSPLPKGEYERVKPQIRVKKHRPSGDSLKTPKRASRRNSKESVQAAEDVNFVKLEDDIRIVTELQNQELEFEEFMEEYRKKTGFEGAKFYVYAGKDQFIRRLLNKRGWIENMNPKSHAFHLK